METHKQWVTSYSVYYKTNQEDDFEFVADDSGNKMVCFVEYFSHSTFCCRFQTSYIQKQADYANHRISKK